MASRFESSTPGAETGLARGVLGPAAVAAAGAVVWLIVDPPSIDLAAQEYRAQLFRDEGFVTSSADWYGGFNVPGYSLLFPPLAAWLGARPLGAIAAVGAAALFAVIARRHAGRNGLLAAYWFAIGIVTQLINGRITFTLGVLAGLATIWAIQARRPARAGLAGALTSAASPVAGLFVALAGTAVVLGERVQGRGLLGNPQPQARTSSRSRSWTLLAAGASAAVAAVAVGVTMAIAWPTDGHEPFATSAFLGIPLLAAAGLLLVPPSLGAVRWGLALYAVLGILAFAIDNPLGSNATRLGSLFGGPVIALALWPSGPRLRRALILIALPLLYWQWFPAVHALEQSIPDHLRDPARTEPLVRQLEAREASAPEGFRVHVPPTRTRWEAKHVAEHFPLARGWLRQLESDDFDLFTDERLTPAAYRGWLADHEVAFVAVPDVKADYLAEDERELIAEGLTYLRRLWSDRWWTLYRFTGASGARAPSG